MRHLTLEATHTKIEGPPRVVIQISSSGKKTSALHYSVSCVDYQSEIANGNEILQ